MANKTGITLSAVLPLPPLEYDVQYMNNLIRILNFFLQQVNNPGLVKCNGLTIEDRDQDTSFKLDPNEEFASLWGINIFGDETFKKNKDQARKDAESFVAKLPKEFFQNSINFYV